MTIIDPQPPDVDADEAGAALAPSDNPTEHAYAWALYPDGPGNDEFGAGRTTLWLWLCTVITAVVVAVLADVLVFGMRERPQSTPTTNVNTTSVAAPTSAAPTPAEAPPTTVTVTASPSETVDAMPSQTVGTLAPAPPTRATPSAADLDERFIASSSEVSN